MQLSRDQGYARKEEFSNHKSKSVYIFTHCTFSDSLSWRTFMVLLSVVLMKSDTDSCGTNWKERAWERSSNPELVRVLDHRFQKVYFQSQIWCCKCAVSRTGAVHEVYQQLCSTSATKTDRLMLADRTTLCQAAMKSFLTRSWVNNRVFAKINIICKTAKMPECSCLLFHKFNKASRWLT